MSDKWVEEYNEKGEAIRWTPWEQYMVRKFISAILERTHTVPMIWGSPKITDKEKIWEIAQQEYQQFSQELPISYLEYYRP